MHSIARLTHHRGLGRKAVLGLLLGIAAWWGGCWLAADAWFERAVESAYRLESTEADQFVASTIAGFDRIVTVRVGMPRVLARDIELRRLMAALGPVAPGAAQSYEERRTRWTADPRFAAWSRQLKADADDLGLTALSLLDSAGNCIAASNADTKPSFVGAGFGGREYFSDILAGRSGYRLTLSAPVPSAGFTFFAPIMDDKKVVGAVAARINLAAFGNWLTSTDAFLTDRNGVIVLAHDPALLLRTTPDAPVSRLTDDMRIKLYQRADLVPLASSPWGDPRFPDLLRVEDRDVPVVLRKGQVTVGSEPTVNVLWPFPQLIEYEVQRQATVLSLGSLGTFALLLGAVLIGRHRERRDARQALARREREFRSLAECSPDFIIRYDIHQRILYLNSSLLHLLNVSSIDEVIGRRPIEVWPDRRYAIIDSAAAHALESGQAVPVEIVNDNSGEMRHYHIEVIPERDDQGKLIGSIAFGRDITVHRRMEEALKESEARYRNNAILLQSVLESPSGVMIFALDREYRYLAFNRAHRLNARKMWGTDIEVGMSFLDAIHTENTEQHREFCRQGFDQVLAGHEHAVESTENFIGEDGWPRDIHFMNYGSPIRNDKGEVVGLTVIVIDITERKRFEAAHEAALMEAERLAQARTAFLAQMSHELRTPLNGILGYAQILLRDSGLSERQRTGLQIIQNSGNHLLMLLGDVLDMAKIEAGKAQLHPADVRLNRFLSTLADIMRGRADQKGLEFVCEFAPDLPQAVCIDELRLRQVLLNLLANAIRYTDRGSVCLRVDFTPPERLRFTVSDTGIGIAQDHFEAIFEPFEQVDEGKRRAGGTGLGLSISRQFVRLMGGDISVQSHPGTGSTFWFEIVAPTVDAERRTPRETRQITGYHGPRRTILIVDDIAENRAVEAAMLDDIGFQTVDAADGGVAIEYATTKQPDLILMDRIMPELDGIEATRRLRSRAEIASIPVIIVSAGVSADAEIESRQAGANAFIAKPIRRDLLLSKIGELLGLEWRYEADEADHDVVETARPPAEPPAPLPAAIVAPSSEDVEALYKLALQGSMRDITDFAGKLAQRDPALRPFVDHVSGLALDYQSKAIVQFIAAYRN